MADIVILEPGKQAQYIRSVHTPDYQGNPNALVNPDLTAVSNVPLKHWKKGTGNTVVEMSVSEKQAITDAETAEKDAQTNALQIDAIVLAKALVKAGVISKTNLITAIKGVLANG